MEEDSSPHADDDYTDESSNSSDESWNDNDTRTRTNYKIKAKVGYTTPSICTDLGKVTDIVRRLAALEHRFPFSKHVIINMSGNKTVTVLRMLFKSKLLDSIWRPLQKRGERYEMELYFVVENRVIKLSMECD